jgi:hypothetical protein
MGTRWSSPSANDAAAIPPPPHAAARNDRIQSTVVIITIVVASLLQSQSRRRSRSMFHTIVIVISHRHPPRSSSRIVVDVRTTDKFAILLLLPRTTNGWMSDVPRRGPSHLTNAAIAGRCHPLYRVEGVGGAFALWTTLEAKRNKEGRGGKAKVEERGGTRQSN